MSRAIHAHAGASRQSPSTSSSRRTDFREMLRVMRLLRTDPLGAMLRGRASYGDTIRFRIINQTSFLVAHPDDIKHVLVDNHRNYNKRTRGMEALKEVIGQGLLTSEGDFWRRQRRIAQPAFHRDRIASFGRAMVDCADEYVDRWQDGDIVDVASEMMHVTLAVVARTLLSADVSTEARDIGSALTTALTIANSATSSLVEFPLYVPTPKNLRLRRAVRTLDEVVLDMIEQRRALTPEDRPDDLLTMLMGATDEETGEGMDDRQLRDEVMTIFLAGHETTANALAWTLYLLSKHPDALRQHVEEVERVIGERRPEAADMMQLPLTTQIVKESMRLYPPAWMVARCAIDDDVVGGLEVPAGSFVFTSPYLTHRHPEFWDNPEGFDPSRFTPDREKARHHFAYFPFGAGPRICIGNRFALMEAVLILARISQAVRLELVPGHPVEPEPIITLRPRHGIRMTVTRP